MDAVDGDLDCAVWAQDVACSAKVAFSLVDVDLWLLCRFALYFRLFGGGYGGFWAGERTDLAADAALFVECQLNVFDLHVPF